MRADPTMGSRDERRHLMSDDENKAYFDNTMRVITALDGLSTHDKLLVVQLAWLTLASNARTDALFVPGGFPEERARQGDQLRKMAELVGIDEPDIEMERLIQDRDVEGMLRHMQKLTDQANDEKGGPMPPMPVVFIGGLSGAGKTELSNWLAADLDFLHLNIDRDDDKDGIDVNDLRREWDLFLHRFDSAPLAAAVRQMALSENRSGAVLSFASTTFFIRPLIEAAGLDDIRTVILDGPPEWCLKAFLERERRTGRLRDAGHWHRNNDKAASIYCSEAYADVRLAAFQPDGSRLARQDLVKAIRDRLKGGAAESYV